MNVDCVARFMPNERKPVVHYYTKMTHQELTILYALVGHSSGDSLREAFLKVLDDEYKREDSLVLGDMFLVLEKAFYNK